MSEAEILMPVVGMLMSVLIVVIGWMGNKLHERLGEISETLISIERDIRKELGAIESRLSVVESRIK